MFLLFRVGSGDVGAKAVSDSPYSERFERKDSIRRFLREQFRDDKKSKESKENKENEKQKESKSGSAATVGATSAAAAITTEPVPETKSKMSAYRLFRTVSIVSSTFSPLVSALLINP